MNLSVKSEEYAILDSIFDEDSYNRFCSYFNDLDFAYRSLTGWQKVWKVSDGLILAGAPYYASKAPHNCLMDVLSKTVSILAEQHLADIVGKKGEDWDDFFMTPYIYPSGTKISWHNDYGYSAAAIFYTHRSWSPNWGGELLIAKTSPEETKNGGCLDSIDRSAMDSVLNKHGMGVYVSPLPNRMVFTKGGVWHSINRVDQVAGDALRNSVVTFFYKKSK